LAICNCELGHDIIGFNVSDELHSDHLPILIQIKSNIRGNSNKKQITMSSVDWDMFRSLSSLNLPKVDTLTGASEIDSVVRELTATLNNALTASTRTRGITISSERFMQLPLRIIDLIKEKRKALRYLKKYRSSEARLKYNHLTATVKKEIARHKKAKWRNFCSKLNLLSPSDGKLWRAINSVDNTSKLKSRPACLKIPNGELSSDDRLTANLFADHLSCIFAAQNDPSFDSFFYEHVENAKSAFFDYDHSAPVLISPEEVKSSIELSIRPSGAPGGDKITNKLIKMLPECYHPILANIYNASLLHCHVPLEWKQSLVVMIPKPLKDHQLPCNHRPISLLSTLSKLLERFVLTRMLDWLENRNLLPPFQSGFRKGKQT
jgi:hypothetical protein